MIVCGKFISKSGCFNKLPLCLAVIMLYLWADKAVAQGRNTAADATKIKQSATVDSTQMLKNGKSDSAAKANDPEALGIKISKDGLPSKITATATDSALMDLSHNVFYLYGDAKVDYEDLKLSAGKIRYDQSSNVVTAAPIIDTGTKRQVPTFFQGSEKFTYDSLQYNFKTQRAIVRNARSQYGEGFVHSTQIKRNADQSLYGFRSVYTTCALEQPHFGIRARKIKIIPGKVIATGAANLEIEGVPTPLYLPFGLFPVSEKHRSGFILPSYTIEQNRGLGITRGGYYFYLNDYADLQVQADVFTKGSWAGYLNSRYINKYHYNGNIGLSYALNKTGESYDPTATITRDFAFVWQHQKDAKSMPGVNFNANVNILSNTFYSNNSYNPNQILQNQYSSNITFSKVWQNTPYSLTASVTHNQNVSTGLVNFTLPDVTFYVASQNVFKRKNPVGSPKWYENITVGYTAHGLNRVSFYDSSLDKIGTSDFSNGLMHSIPVSASYSVFRFIKMSLNAGYNEYWYTQSLYRSYNDATGKIDSVLKRGFYSARDFNANIQLNTRIYGTVFFKKGNLRGIRHMITPTVGFAYRPDFASDPFNYYYRTRLDTSRNTTLLSPYEGAVIGVPPSGKAGNITMGLNNNLQIKVRSSKDTVTGFRNIVIFDELSVNTSYNLAVDSFNWSSIELAARTNVADRVSLRATASFDPYRYDYVNMRRTAETMYGHGSGIGRLTNASVMATASLRSTLKSNYQPPANVNNNADDDYSRLMRNNGYLNYVDFNVPWNLSVTYSLGLTRTPSSYSRSDTSIINQNVTLGGDFNLTPRWKLAFSTGYDFTFKEFSLTNFQIYRDLHCWEMRFDVYPFGPRQSFTFTLNVKAQVLHDLRLLRRRDFRDAIQ